MSFFKNLGNEFVDRFENKQYGDDLKTFFDKDYEPKKNEWLETPEFNVDFGKTNSSYSGTDCQVFAIYNEDIVSIGSLQTLSYSIFRDKKPVRTLGRINPKGHTTGQRTIAGSLIFISFDRHPLYFLFKYFDHKSEYQHRFSMPMSDEIPAFDIMLVFTNEYGYQSIMKIYAVELFSEGGVFSINDIYSENTIQFLAQDIDPMYASGDRDSVSKLIFNKMTKGEIIDENLTHLLDYRQRLQQQYDNVYQRYKSAASQSAGYITDDESKPENYRFIREKIWNKGVENKNAQEKARLLKKQLESLAKKLKEVDRQIDLYERNYNTSDMNYAFEEMGDLPLEERELNKQSRSKQEAVTPPIQQDYMGGREAAKTNQSKYRREAAIINQSKYRKKPAKSNRAL